MRRQDGRGIFNPSGDSIALRAPARHRLGGQDRYTPYKGRRRPIRTGLAADFKRKSVVGVRGFEPPASTSRERRAPDPRDTFRQSLSLANRRRASADLASPPMLTPPGRVGGEPGFPACVHRPDQGFFWGVHRKVIPPRRFCSRRGRTTLWSGDSLNPLFVEEDTR